MNDKTEIIKRNPKYAVLFRIRNKLNNNLKRNKSQLISNFLSSSFLLFHTNDRLVFRARCIPHYNLRQFQDGASNGFNKHHRKTLTLH